jgi:Tol biopolymer transport system component
MTRTGRGGAVVALATAGLTLASCGEDAPTAPDADPDTGTLSVVVATSGGDPDPDGYTLSVDGGAAGPLVVTGTLTLSDVPAGQHMVELGDVADNCAVTGDNPVGVAVAAGATASAAFDVACVGALVDKIAFTTNRDGNDEIYLMDQDGGAPTNLTNHPSEDSGPSISPDGRRIAFVTGRAGNYEIYVMNADGTGVTRLTDHPARDSWPVWSPDGSRISFVSNREGNDDIFVMNADGSGQVNLSQRPATEESSHDWSPDGTRIVFTAYDDENRWQIFTMKVDGTQQAQLFVDPDGAGEPDWSPDGSRLVLSINRAPQQPVSPFYQSEVVVMNADGSDWTRLTWDDANDLLPRWSPDGTRIAFVSDRTGDYEVFVMNADGSDPVNLTLTPGAGDLVWSPQSWSPK